MAKCHPQGQATLGVGGYGFCRYCPGPGAVGPCECAHDAASLSAQDSTGGQSDVSREALNVVIMDA
jgi:hypothetical protein